MVTLTVRDIMTTEVVTIFDDETMEAAEQIMSAGRVHHLPVLTRSGRLVGALSRCDVLRATMSCLAEPTADEETAIKQSIPVAIMMSPIEIMLTMDTSVRRAARLLRRYDYGCLPVVDGAQLVGLVTKGNFVDLVDRLLDEPDGLAAPSAFEDQGHLVDRREETRAQFEPLR